MFNTLQWPRREVVDIAALEVARNNRVNKSGTVQPRAANYALVTADAFGLNTATPVTPTNPATVGNTTLLRY